MLHLFGNFPRNSSSQMTFVQQSPLFVPSNSKMCFMQTRKRTKSVVDLKHWKHWKSRCIQSNTQFNKRFSTLVPINCKNNFRMTFETSNVTSSAVSVRSNVQIDTGAKECASDVKARTLLWQPTTLGNNENYWRQLFKFEPANT